MRNYIIGTAGHVDHGKTSLIKALTGVDADRLKEEKSRGITIDIGFANMSLPHFANVGIIDVPGHEKFIKNMLAGAPGTSLALIVIASNEGVMMQTREHIDILSVLGVKKAVVALNKIDLINDDSVDDAIANVRAYLDDTVFRNAPIVPTDAVSNKGIDELKNKLDEALLELDKEDKCDEALPFFMPIDRSFSIKGFGTVITGTVKSGQVHSGNEYILYPAGKKLCVRSIQIHGQDEEVASCGQRAALNVKDYAKEEIVRGDIIADASFVPTMMLDVKLTILSDSRFELLSGEKVRVNYGAGEYVAKVVLGTDQKIMPGQSAYAQLRFDRKLIASHKDRFVIRRLSPAVTIGGGTVIDPFPIIKQKDGKLDLASFNIKENGTCEERIYQYISEHRSVLIKKENINVGNSCQETDNAVINLIDSGRIISLPNEYLITKERLDELLIFLKKQLKEYQAANPDMPGMMLAEAKMKLLGRGRSKEAKAIIAYYLNADEIKEAGNCLSTKDFEIVICANEEAIEQKLLDIYEKSGINPPAYNDVKILFLKDKRFNSVIRKLLESKELIQLDERYIVTGKTYEFAKEKLVLLARHSTDGMISLGQYRDRIKSSRKVALAFLEHFDKNGITVKKEDLRFLK